jgi:hypothetical protein
MTAGQRSLAVKRRFSVRKRTFAVGTSRQFQDKGIDRMIDAAEKRGQIIRHLEDALALTDELQEGQTGFLIERALDEARSRQFKPVSE